MPEISRIIVPQETANNDSVTVVTLISENGSEVVVDEVVCEIETSKATVEITSPHSGYIEFLVEEDQELIVGACIALIHDEWVDVSAGPTAGRQSGSSDTASPAEDSEASAFSKGALSLISKYGLEKREFEHLGFVRSADILGRLRKFGAETRSVVATPLQDVSHLPIFKVSTTVENAPPNKLLEIDYLLSSQNSISSSVSIKIKVEQKNSEKVEVEEAAKRKGAGVFKNLDNALTPLILSETCSLLKKYRVFNSFYHGRRIHYYDEVHLGYAMDMGEDKGLRVVNLGDLSDHPIARISGKILDFVRLYLTNKIPPKDLVDSTFTVSDLSSEGCLSFTPLINRYQSAILGIAAIDEDDGSVILTLTFDHRVAEGRRACQFLLALKQQVERLLGEHRS